MFSTLSGRAVNGDELDGSYWVQNMVSQVQYLAAVRQMMTLPADKRPNIIVELSPRSTLKSPTLDILADMGIRSAPAYLSALDRKSSGPESLLQAIGGLWARGHHVDMEKVIARE
jgi:acyl transferase domain-containing protein